MSEESAVQIPTESAATEATDQTSVLGDAEVEVKDTDKGVLDDSDTKDDSEGKAEETDETEEKKDTDGAPEKYEFTLPEGQEVSAAAMEKFEPVLRDLNLSTEKAQKLAGALGEYEAGRQAEIDTFMSNQKAEAMKIPAAEIGLAKQALGLFPDEAKAIKDDIYMRDNPAVIRYLAKIGGLAAEAKYREGADKSVSAPRSFEDKADNMYK